MAGGVRVPEGGTVGHWAEGGSSSCLVDSHYYSAAVVIVVVVVWSGRGRNVGEEQRTRTKDVAGRGTECVMQ